MRQIPLDYAAEAKRLYGHTRQIIEWPDWETLPPPIRARYASFIRSVEHIRQKAAGNRPEPRRKAGGGPTPTPAPPPASGGSQAAPGGG